MASPAYAGVAEYPWPMPNEYFPNTGAANPNTTNATANTRRVAQCSGSVQARAVYVNAAPATNSVCPTNTQYSSATGRWPPVARRQIEENSHTSVVPMYDCP